MTPSDEELRGLLREARRIAVVGLSRKPHRASHQVARYLQDAGYAIVPIHPAGGVTLGEPVHPDLSSAARTGTLDVVDVFRRSEYVPALLDELLAVRPRLVWMQVGVQDAATAERLEAAGIRVVMNRCLSVEHERLGV